MVTVGPTGPLSHVRARVAASPHRFALLTTTDGILLGRLRAAIIDAGGAGAGATPAGAVMEPGPSTLRPHEPAASVKTRLEGKGPTYAIVTDPDGRLLGTVHPADLGGVR